MSTGRKPNWEGDFSFPDTKEVYYGRSPPLQEHDHCSPAESMSDKQKIEKSSGIARRNTPRNSRLETPLDLWSMKIRSQMRLYLLFGIAITLVLCTAQPHIRNALLGPENQLLKLQPSSAASAAATSTPVLEVFQVHQPVLTPFGYTSDGSSFVSPSEKTLDSCSLLLMEYSFAFSYGQPFIGNYSPPPCSFNRVVMNFTVESKGRQFDRLAIMYFGDTEIWRISTAEPKATGIKWTYTKDMSEYMYFWKQPQKIIFDLGNLVDSTYTGLFNTTLTATFFTVQDTPMPASLIIPISARNGISNQSSFFMLPSTQAINNITIPRNASRAVFTISSCGQSNEEFWWANLLQSNVNTFPDGGTLPGFSPWREVQLYIDGNLAGVQWPFPIVFTGGIVPSLWRPIVGIDAFDLREREIDITPWLSFLNDEQPHSFEIKVAGILDDGNTGIITDTVDYSWYVTGKIFIWESSSTTFNTADSAPTSVLPAPIINLSQSVTQSPNGTNITLVYSLAVKRTISISSTLLHGTTSTLSTWTQDLTFTTSGHFSSSGIIQNLTLNSSGTDTALSNSKLVYCNTYNYPVAANLFTLIAPDGNVTLTALVSRGLETNTVGASVLPESFPLPQGAANAAGTWLRTNQKGSGYYFSSPSTKTGFAFGNTLQEFSWGDILVAGGEKEVYSRRLSAVNDSVVRDTEVFLGDVLRDLEIQSVASEAISDVWRVEEYEALSKSASEGGDRELVAKLIGRH